jgi:hypothetical protein
MLAVRHRVHVLIRPIVGQDALHRRHRLLHKEMAALPPSVAVKYTSPGLLQTAAVFFVGNLFANFLFLVAAVVLLSRYLHIWGLFVAIIIAYYASLAASKAHKTGGLQSLRPWTIGFLKHTREYFDLQQIHEGGLKDGEKYIFCCHPHGIHGFGTGIFMDDSNTSELYALYPFLRGKVVGLVATVLFFLPLVRELFLSMGTRDASRQVAEQTLEEGNSIYLIVGGEAESLRSLPGTDEVVAAGKGRKGFVRLALRKNALLVPVYMVCATLNIVPIS